MASNCRSGKRLQNVKWIFWYFVGSQYGFGHFMITIILNPVVRHVVSLRNLMGIAPFRRKGNCDNLYLENWSNRWALKFAVFSLIWIQCLMWKCSCCSLWWSKRRDALTQQPEEHFCFSLEEIKKFLPCICSLWSYSAWIQLAWEWGKILMLFLVFFPQPAMGLVWVWGSVTVTPWDWPAAASFHLNHQASVFKDFFFPCWCNLMYVYLGENKVLFYSCLSHSWASLGNKSEASCL